MLTRLEGAGSTNDELEALKWLTIAASSTHLFDADGGQRVLDAYTELSDAMAPDARAASRRLAHEWLTTFVKDGSIATPSIQVN